MLDRLRKLIGAARRETPTAAAPAAESDHRCPCCGHADAVKIDPLITEMRQRPRLFGGARPRLCMRCYTLLLVDADGRATAAEHADILVFRAAWPQNWRAIVACQEDFQRRQIFEIRSQTFVKKPHD